MPKALFKSHNLLGDGLLVSMALRAWHKQHPDYDIDLMTHPDHIASIYGRMGVPVNVITDNIKRNGPYDFEHVFNINEAFRYGEQLKLHASEAYAQILFGTDFKSEEIGITYEPVEEEHPTGLLLMSPFSRSCSSNQGKPPNKMLPWPVWLEIMNLLRSHGDIGVIGAKHDRMPLPLPIAENEYYCGLPLNKVALILRDARLLVTIDNGIAHLATSQKTPMVEFYPACLGTHWVTPAGNPRAYVLQIDPAQVRSAADILTMIRHVIRRELA